MMPMTVPTMNVPRRADIARHRGFRKDAVTWGRRRTIDRCRNEQRGKRCCNAHAQKCLHGNSFVEGQSLSTIRATRSCGVADHIALRHKKQARNAGLSDPPSAHQRR